MALPALPDVNELIAEIDAQVAVAANNFLYANGGAPAAAAPREEPGARQPPVWATKTVTVKQYRDGFPVYMRVEDGKFWTKRQFVESLLEGVEKRLKETKPGTPDHHAAKQAMRFISPHLSPKHHTNAIISIGSSTYDASGHKLSWYEGEWFRLKLGEDKDAPGLVEKFADKDSYFIGKWLDPQHDDRGHHDEPRRKRMTPGVVTTKAAGKSSARAARQAREFGRRFARVNERILDDLRDILADIAP